MKPSKISLDDYRSLKQNPRNFVDTYVYGDYLLLESLFGKGTDGRFNVRIAAFGLILLLVSNLVMIIGTEFDIKVVKDLLEMLDAMFIVISLIIPLFLMLGGISSVLTFGSLKAMIRRKIQFCDSLSEIALKSQTYSEFESNYKLFCKGG